MLSKSQARLFFLTATIGFSGVFLGLTVDTIRQIPERTNIDNMSDEAKAGRHIWDQNNCMGCHTLFGEGAYYAPELTRVVERRGEEWMRIFLRDPEAMYPGRRRMVQYDFTEDEITEVIAFLEWIGGVDANGFPFDPDMRPDGAVSASGAIPESVIGAPAMYTSVCSSCHAVEGYGGNVGPALDEVATRYTAEELDTWLADPNAVKPGTTMPNLNIEDSVRAELVEFLITLD